ARNKLYDSVWFFEWRIRTEKRFKEATAGTHITESRGKRESQGKWQRHIRESILVVFKTFYQIFLLCISTSTIVPIFCVKSIPESANYCHLFFHQRLQIQNYRSEGG
ncbi:hypothetical protein KI387_040579, partial [Taxus chinensis]